MSQYTIRPLDTETWDAYARLMDKHLASQDWRRRRSAGRHGCYNVHHRTCTL
jgi:hypothetical protein